MKKVNIYFDTSAKSPREQDGIGVYVLEAVMEKGNATATKVMNLKGVTANQAQLQTLADALGRLREACNISVYTESGYVASGIESLAKWQRDGWKTSRGTELANKKEWCEIAAKTQNSNMKSVLKEHHEYRSWIKTEIERRIRNE